MDLLNTLNMVIECIENFLEAFEKKFRAKNGCFGKKSQPHFETGFLQKSGLWYFSLNIFSLTRRITRMALLFFTDVKNNVRRTF